MYEQNDGGGGINYEWRGLGRRGGALCTQITSNKSGHIAMTAASKVNLWDNYSCCVIPS